MQTVTQWRRNTMQLRKHSKMSVRLLSCWLCHNATLSGVGRANLHCKHGQPCTLPLDLRKRECAIASLPVADRCTNRMPSTANSLTHWRRLARRAGTANATQRNAHVRTSTVPAIMHATSLLTSKLHEKRNACNSPNKDEIVIECGVAMVAYVAAGNPRDGVQLVEWSHAE